ncbi:hypothetical protein ACVDG8_034565 [Mesorhizobium sp. ORM8.1]
MKKFEIEWAPSLERPKRGRKSKSFNGTHEDKKYLDAAIAGINAGAYRDIDHAANQIIKNALGECDKKRSLLRRNLKKHFSIAIPDR